MEEKQEWIAEERGKKTHYEAEREQTEAHGSEVSMRVPSESSDVTHRDRTRRTPAGRIWNLRRRKGYILK